MRWNRMITSICIFLLSLSRTFVAVIGVLAIVFMVIGNTDDLIAFSVDNYQFDDVKTFTAEPSDNTVNYDRVTVVPKVYSVVIEGAPISNYSMGLSLLIIAPILYYFLGLVIKLLKTIEEREFFSLENVRRLRVIGLMVVGFAIVKWLYSMILDHFLKSDLKIEGFSKVSSGFFFNFDFLGSLWFLGLMILLVANAFEHGVRLKEEQELTI